MKKIHNDFGLLSKDGDELVSSFKQSLQSLLDNDSVKKLSESEFRTFACNLKKVLGDMVSWQK